MYELAGLLSFKSEDSSWGIRLCTVKSKTLAIYKNNSYTDIDKKLLFSTDTRVELVESTDGCAPLISVKNADSDPIFLRVDNKTNLQTWFSVLTSAAVCGSPLTIGDFDILKNIGTGAYGKVKLARKKDTGSIYAIKTIHKNKLVEKKRVDYIMQERNALTTVSCPFIVQLYYAFQNERKCYLCLEYVPGGDLFAHLRNVGSIPLNDVTLYAAEIAVALNSLHMNHIIYRDLKPENILIDEEGHIKLTDFGLSKNYGEEIEKSKSTSFCGTAEYLAPEIVAGEPYGFEIDWWSLGILIYEMLFKSTPFCSMNANRVYEKIQKSSIIFPGTVDKDVVSLINGLTEKDPKKRFGYKEVMSHPLLKCYDVEKLCRKEYSPSYIPLESAEMDEYKELFPHDECLDGTSSLFPTDSIGSYVESPYQRIQGFSYTNPIYDDLVIQNDCN